MINTKFEAYKLTREIRKNGNVASVYRKDLNEFDEPVGKERFVGKIPCIFHTSKEYVTKNVSDGTVARTLGSPMLLCLLESVVGVDANVGDIVKIDGDEASYELVDINDIQEWGIIADISLRVIDNGE